ncbi:MAG TPA: glycosyltransferase, partial [Candidatus Saccharimonadales bacterium]|nr:glycosyltransferase [Candidatus Saccharimonadales bacterium]
MNETEIQVREHRSDGLGSPAPAVPVLLIIPARVADRTLDSCVHAVRDSSTEHPLEILVVWDGAGGGRCDGAVRQTRSPVLSSAAAARNHGASQLRQGILVFLDADVLVSPHTVDRLIEPILAGAAEATVGNYSLDVTGLNFLQSYKQLHVATVYGRRRGYIKSEFWTAIGAVRADVFHQLGGFNTGFRGACGEDTELGQRLTAAGHRVWAVAEATGRHLHRFTLATLLLNDLRKGTQTA